MSFSVNVSGTPAFVFQPNTTSTAPQQTLRLQNINQSQTVYFGSLAALSTPNAFPPGLAPNRILDIAPVTAAVYVSAGYVAGTNSSTLTTNATAGSTAFTVASATHFAVGTLAILGNLSSGQEIASVTGTTATAVTVSTALLYNHVSGETVATATANVAQVLVNTGVV
jgi:hypothetical protein